MGVVKCIELEMSDLKVAMRTAYEVCTEDEEYLKRVAGMLKAKAARQDEAWRSVVLAGTRAAKEDGRPGAQQILLAAGCLLEKCEAVDGNH